MHKFKNASLLATAALALALAAPVSAVTIAEEDFETYSAGVSINGDNGGTGWGGPWTGVGVAVESVADVTGNPLQYTEPITSTLISGGTKTLRITGSNDNAVFREFSPVLDDDILYVSFLFRVGAVAGADLESNDFVAFWFDNLTTGQHLTGPAFALKANRGDGSGTEDFFTRFSQTDIAYAPLNLNVGQTYFIVVSYEKQTSGAANPYNRSRIWVNPPVNGGPGLFPPPSATVTLPSGGFSSLRYFGVRSYTTITGGDEIELDRFRIATSWGGIWDEGTLLVELDSFEATAAGPGSPVTLNWVTASEVDNVGFHVHRTLNGESTRLTSSLIPATGGEGVSASYTFTDSTVDPASTEVAEYYLEDVDIYGKSTFHGPAAFSSTSTNASVSDWVLYDF
jgi:hypothetical protein